jgi:hypothetical protein
MSASPATQPASPVDELQAPVPPCAPAAVHAHVSVMEAVAKFVRNLEIESLHEGVDGYIDVFNGHR